MARNSLQKRCFIRDVPDWLWPTDLYLSDDPESLNQSYSGVGALMNDRDPDLDEFQIPPRVAEEMDWL